MILNIFEIGGGIFVAIAILRRLFYWIGFGNSRADALGSLNREIDETWK